MGFLLSYPKAFESFLSHLVYYTKSIFLWDTFSFLLFCDLPFKYQTRVIETASRIFKYIISGCHRLNALLYHVEYGSQSPRSIKTANYIYIVPLVTLITSAIFLSETITIASGIGALAIISGVYIAER